MGPLLVQLFEEDATAGDVLQRLLNLGDEARNLTPLLWPLIERDYGPALDLLAYLGERHPRVLAEAERRVAAVMKREPRSNRSRWQWGAVDVRASVYALLLPEGSRVALARQWLLLARDLGDVELNRAMALDGIALLAKGLPADTKAALFPDVLAFTDPFTQLHEIDTEFRQSQHPLSRFKFDFGIGSLRCSALVASAALAGPPETVQKVEAEILRTLRSQERSEVQAACHAIQMLDRSGISLGARLLAAHSSSFVREVAAFLWARDRDRERGVGLLLASDRESRVRATVASGIGCIMETDAALGTELRALLLQDQSALVRLLAARSETVAASSGDSATHR